MEARRLNPAYVTKYLVFHPKMCTNVVHLSAYHYVCFHEYWQWLAVTRYKLTAKHICFNLLFHRLLGIGTAIARFLLFLY